MLQPKTKSIALQRYSDEVNDYFIYRAAFLKRRQPEDFEQAVYHGTLAELAERYLRRAGGKVQHATLKKEEAKR